MAPTRSQTLIHGSKPSPLSRSTVGNTSGSRLPVDPNASWPVNDNSPVSQTTTFRSQPFFGPGSRSVLNNATFQVNHHIHQGNSPNALKLLYQMSSPAASYNSKDRHDPPKCHPNTRKGLLGDIHVWTQKRLPYIYWLYGSAGAGKSAIAQTVSEDLKSSSNLAASFFFSRTSSAATHRGHEERFVTTLAYQLALSVPGLRSYIERTVDNIPSVFDLTLVQQVTDLIIEPLKQLKHDSGQEPFPCTFPRIVVVDGLDECKEESGQKQVLEAIATLVGHQDVYPFSVFLSSRPELVIRSWFAATHAKSPSLAQSVSLLDKCDSDHDIEVFVNAETAEIRQSHPFKAQIPLGWPSPGFVKKIVERANGQFVYASVIMKYIRDLRHHPDHRLESILQDTIPQHDRPYAELDVLYLYILRQTQYPALVHQILAFRIVTISFAAEDYREDFIDYLETFLGLSTSVEALLIDLQSIIHCDADGMRFSSDSDGDSGPTKKAMCLDVPIPSIFHHASLLEFLLNPQCSEEFYIDIAKHDDDFCKMALKYVCDSDSDDDEDYTIYCFLILIQTQASRQATYRDSILAALSEWDSLNNFMLYDILRRLLHRMRTDDGVFDSDDVFDPHLWKVFAPAVARRRAQCQQDLERAKLPPEMLVIYEHDLFKVGSQHHTCDLPEIPNLFHSIAWHMYTSIQQDTGADPWDFFHFAPPRSFWDYNYHVWCILIETALDQSEHITYSIRLELERQQNNALKLTAAVVFCINHIISLLDPIGDASRPKEIQATFDALGGNWRAIVAAHLLYTLQDVIYHECAVSADVVSALEALGQLVFPPDVVSTLEDVDFFPSSVTLRQLLGTFCSPCALPRWFLNTLIIYELPRTNLGALHDYISSIYTEVLVSSLMRMVKVAKKI
ncbi:hypothetical protein BJ165DRAFT_366910 [Panaeolus papilionaceus]|nr:hypothetical protein BJ165DRAFT_366910 [Panaeolus papilionaceus]